MIQEALQAHASGLKYRERNAGPAVDRDMSDEGQIIDLSVLFTCYIQTPQLIPIFQQLIRLVKDNYRFEVSTYPGLQIFFKSGGPK